MTLQYSTTLRNNKLDQITSTIGASPKFRIYTGAAPANCAATETGTLLCEITCPATWMNAASGGSKTMTGTWSASASATGTAAHFRMYDSTGTTCHAQGTVGTSAADMIVQNTSFSSGQNFTVTSFTVNDNNG